MIPKYPIPPNLTPLAPPSHPALHPPNKPASQGLWSRTLRHARAESRTSQLLRIAAGIMEAVVHATRIPTGRALAWA